jgi:hypothetical protein
MKVWSPLLAAILLISSVSAQGIEVDIFDYDEAE